MRPSPSPSPRYGRSPTVLWRSYWGETLLAGGDGDIHSLGGTAAAVWDLLERPRTIGEISDLLGRWYQGPPDRVREDVASLIDELHRQRFVQRETEPGG